MELSERITLARKQAGLSQEQLGEKLGVSRQAVSKWESGQTNPDIAYLAEMCRLFGVSADWLLLGEECAKEAAPAQCPDCQAVVTGLDKFCPNCGRSLQAAASGTYTLLLKPQSNCSLYYPDDLSDLSKTAWFSADSPLGHPIEMDQARALFDAAPCILARGLSAKTASDILAKVLYPDNFAFYRDSDGTDPATLIARKPVPPNQFAFPKEPLSFGMVVLAVILGVVGAVFLLAIL